MTRAWMIALSLIACGTERERSSTPVPSCALPICEPCACDLTFACDEGCSCDPECGSCRAPEAACRGTGDAGTGDTGIADGGDAGLDAGPCSFPPSQGLSMPCCTSRGIDACGAGLFCAAFDGRTQPTCYAERSRTDLETCGADIHCGSGECAPEGRCRSLPDQICEAAVGCAVFSGERYGCDIRQQPNRCERLHGGKNAFCLEAGDCRAQACVDSSCLGEINDSCSTDEECGTNICEFGSCRCSPIPPTACAPEERCDPSNLSCEEAGSVPIGGECSSPSDCASPGMCAGFGPAPTCLEPCRLPDGPCTQQRANCADVFGNERFGICL